MSKELPYFKFEPSEWDNGNIQMCSRESKGLFIDLCSIYWTRLGELPHALALQKLCNGNKDALQELIKHDIIGIVGDQIVIQFLDEQLEDRGQISEKRRESAQKRWSDANALQLKSKSNAKRIEENREEKKKKEAPINFSDDFYQSASEAFEEIKNDQIQMERLLMIVRNSGFRGCNEVTMTLAMKHFFTVESAKPGFLNRPRDDIKQHLVNWTNKNAKTIDQYAK